MSPDPRQLHRSTRLDGEKPPTTQLQRVKAEANRSLNTLRKFVLAALVVVLALSVVLAVLLAAQIANVAALGRDARQQHKAIQCILLVEPQIRTPADVEACILEAERTEK